MQARESPSICGQTFNMIITKLDGGLGNQMFQYAAGRRLSCIHNVDIKLDISRLKKSTLRAYNLGVFNIQEKFTQAEEIPRLASQTTEMKKRALTLWKNLQSMQALTYVQERHFHFDSEILNLPDNVYLDGYWQCERYFFDIQEIIRREFTVKYPQQGRDQALAELIAASESASLHIRRTDYVTNPVANSVLGPCPLEYYYHAVKYLTQTVRNPHFFVFSDEPEWVCKHLNLAHPTTIVEHNGAGKSYEDMRLMSQCKHHIIANSSFSWWGAWLSAYSQKIIIAPRKWFNSPDWDAKDLIPSTWIRL